MSDSTDLLSERITAVRKQLERGEGLSSSSLLALVMDLQDHILSQAETAELRCNTVNALVQKERHILCERLMSEDPKTLVRLAEELGISAPRVRQIEMRLLKRLGQIVGKRPL